MTTPTAIPVIVVKHGDDYIVCAGEPPRHAVTSTSPDLLARMKAAARQQVTITVPSQRHSMLTLTAGNDTLEGLLAAMIAPHPHTCIVEQLPDGLAYLLRSQ